MADTTTNSDITAYGLLAGLIGAYPELQKVYDLASAGDATQAELEFYKTNYYKNLNALAQDRTKKKVNQPGVYAQELQTYKLQQQQRLAQKGVALSQAQLDSIITDAFDRGLSDVQLDLTAAGMTSKFGGTTLGNAQSLNDYANTLGMSYTQSALNSWSQALFAGTQTVYDIQAKIRQDAASAFPSYAEQINKGVSMDALASSYKSAMANILEIDADSISYNDPTLRKALQFVDASGKPAAKPLWQFEQELRNDPRWEQTNNARQTVDTLSLKVLRDFGLVG
jgi:hypothetical protein